MRIKMLAIAVLLTEESPRAHHGGTSLYDMSKVVTAQAMVTDFQWTNPHVEIGLDAKDDKGKVRHWILEANSTPVMVNRGWNRKTLQPGEMIKVSFNPSSLGAEALDG